MRIHLTVFISVFLALICPVNTSFSGSPEELEGSGNDLESSASGSGGWWNNVLPGEKKNAEDVQTFLESKGDGAMNPSHDFPVNFDEAQWPSEDSYVVLADSRSFLENKEILYAIITGGIIGAALAVAVAVFFIYQWQKKDDERSILERQISSEEYYHRKYKDEFVVV